MKRTFKTIRMQAAAFLSLLLLITLAILASFFLYQKRHKRIEQLHKQLKYIENELQNIKTLERNFLLYERTNPRFYETGESIYIKQHEQGLDLLSDRIGLLSQIPNQNKQIQSQIQYFKNYLKKYRLQFDSLVLLRKTIGYKNYGIIGDIREHIHQAENSSFPYPKTTLLMLRRHEKDYLLRGKEEYVTKLKQTTDKLMRQIRQKSQRPAEKQKLLKHLKAYKKGFLQLVKLDNKIGHTPDEGLQARLSEQYIRMEIGISRIEKMVEDHINATNEQISTKFKIVFGIGTAISFVLLFFFLRNLGKPANMLCKSLKSIVDNDFNTEKQIYQPSKNNEIGEIGKYTALMHNKILSYKQRMQEETHKRLLTHRHLKTLVNAGQKLMSLRSIPQILELAYKHLNDMIKAPYFSIGLVDKKRYGLVFYGKEPGNENIKKGFDSLKNPNYLSVYCFTHNKEVFSNNINLEYARFVEELLTTDEASRRTSVIYVPVGGSDKIYGVITVQSKNKNAYSEYDITIVRHIANYIAFALECNPQKNL